MIKSFVSVPEIQHEEFNNAESACHLPAIALQVLWRDVM
jgi:hypothetical protein